MFQFPFILAAVIFFFLLLIFLFIMVQVGLVTVAFAKLGLTTSQAFLVLLATLAGSGMNLPILHSRRMIKVPSPNGPPLNNPFYRHMRPMRPFQAMGELRKQVVAVNVGGCLIPLLLSAYFVSLMGFTPALLLCTALVTAACFAMARPIPGVGIGIPMLVPPLVTAIIAILLAPPEHAPQIAYVSGTMGTLLGADILHLLNPRTWRNLDAPVLSIGGAGTFDGIFVTGILAVLLA
ncbi:putative membrane protein [Desulfocurvibacter africanus PCS]|uniref:Putative membrane protein n=1 Tax=Desulfocurvibacter africanus PCS TaxID=1262666 RepID=M5Q027_DESAF|nr:DUF1614 domain-containing protein [Desulfocurvibacter africanus]EMG36346.1 putative membrane protein [Desulfocurvibacter africanus PCS]